MVNKGFPQDAAGIEGPGIGAALDRSGGRARENAADCEAVGVAAVGSGSIMATRLIERLKIRFPR